jgi:lysozyme
MKISEKGINIIKKFEGCKLTSYKCPAGVWTIGYGHIRNVHKGAVITQQQAEELLKQDLSVYEAGVNAMQLNVNQNQYDALISFAFNLGLSALGKSTLLKKIRLNANDITIKYEFMKWVNAGGKQCYGLVKRRQAECDLYFS